MASSVIASRYLILFLCLGASLVTQAQSVSERLRSLQGLVGGSAQQDFLHPDEAFRVAAAVQGPARLNVQWAIAEGYYLYHDKFSFEIIEGDAAVNQTGVSVPPGKVKEDPSFGSVEVNIGDIAIAVPLIRDVPGATPVTLQVGYQGCKDDSLCYPPIKKTLPLILPAMATGAGDNPATAAAGTGIAAQSGPVISEQDAFTQGLIEGGILLNAALFLGAGLLLAFTPCVFPMVPILSGIIVGQGRQLKPGKAFTLSLVYVLAMASTYAVIGVLAAMAGVNVQAAAQNVWVITLFSLVFIALALSMFGFYEIRMPAALQDRLVRVSNSQRGGTLAGVAIMGAVSAIIVGPCVAPPLVGALTYISQTGNEVLGGLALFSLGLGMGVPLLVIGSSAGSLLPRAGRWMETVKKVFGVGLLGLAIWFLSRIIPTAAELYLWATLLIVTAIYMGALDQLDRAAGWARLWKGLGLIMLVYGVLLVIGASSGSRNIYKPLEGLAGSGSGVETASHLTFTRIKSVADLDARLAQASQAGRPVMLDFYADWCIECIRMERNTFNDPAVRAALEQADLLQADVTANDETDKALLAHFGIYGPPAILFFGTDGEEIRAYRFFGYAGPGEFAGHVRQAFGES